MARGAGTHRLSRQRRVYVQNDLPRGQPSWRRNLRTRRKVQLAATKTRRDVSESRRRIVGSSPQPITASAAPGSGIRAEPAPSTASFGSCGTRPVRCLRINRHRGRTDRPHRGEVSRDEPTHPVAALIGTLFGIPDPLKFLRRATGLAATAGCIAKDAQLQARQPR